MISTEPKPGRALPQSRARLSALGMPDLPEPLVGRHEAFLSAAVLHAPRETRRPLEHENFQPNPRAVAPRPRRPPSRMPGERRWRSHRTGAACGVAVASPSWAPADRSGNTGAQTGAPQWQRCVCPRQSAGGRGFLIANRYESLTVAIALTLRRWLGQIAIWNRQRGWDDRADPMGVSFSASFFNQFASRSAA